MRIHCGCGAEYMRIAATQVISAFIFKIPLIKQLVKFESKYIIRSLLCLVCFFNYCSLFLFLALSSVASDLYMSLLDLLSTRRAQRCLHVMNDTNT